MIGAWHLVAYLRVFGLQPIQALLNHVVSIKILDELHNLALQSADNGVDLLTGGEKLNHLLQRTGAVLVEGNLHQTRGSRVDEDGTLLVGGELEKLLAEVVTEGVCLMLEGNVALVDDQIIPVMSSTT